MVVQRASLTRIGKVETRRHPFRARHRIAWVVGGVLAATLACGCQPARWGKGFGARPGESIRAIWVTRWDYKTAGDIARIMENCRLAGFNTVLFQVRSNGTAFYRSKLEPWADELGGRYPGFDPLKVACAEAHRRNLGLHAWVNVMPGWRGDERPTDRRQLYWAHPDWFWRDKAGRRQPLGWYNSVNPCYPEVRRYLVAVMREIVGGYPIDGLHMDYIRFPNDWHESYSPASRVPDYPRDPRTVAMFRGATGGAPESSPRQWNAWRTGQVTQLVRDIRAMVAKVRPGAALSAAVGASAEEALRKHFQDSRRWIAEGLLDAVYPMNYNKDMRVFSGRLAAWSGSRSRVPVVTGVMFDHRPSSTVIGQIKRVARRRAHFAAFAYNSLFERLDRRRRPIMDAQSPERASLRRQVIPYLKRLAGRRG